MDRRGLVREVEDILELPSRGNKGTGFKIVKSIIDTITKALQNGETVSIRGFGTFEPYTRRTKDRLLPLHQHKGPNGERIFVNIPSRLYTRARFRSDKYLRDFVKEGIINES